MMPVTLSLHDRHFDMSDPEVLWLCRQNMIWDDEPRPRSCDNDAPHPDIGSGCCGWSLVFAERVPKEEK